jgi:FMN phosphatase YigB (HAD superfamily)
MEVAHAFSAVVTSVEHGKRKPAASIFEQALKITGGRSDQSIYVGDSF